MFGGSSSASLRPDSAIDDEADGGVLGELGGSAGGGGRARKNSKSSSPSTSPPDAKKGGPSLTSAIPTFDSRKGSGGGSAGGSGNNSPPTGDATTTTTDPKKRRSSGVGGRASSLLASAKNSLSFGQVGRAISDASANQTPLQKLGKQDAALAVPQGQHNNSAGESQPGPRSTFRVGVWEDRNKKCRRTMEDTHAFLYNFLRTPAPPAATVAASAKLSVNSASDVAGSTAGGSSSRSSRNSNSHVDDLADEPLETDNGYFAIFDGHAGTFAADWCGKKLHLILEDTIRKNPHAPVPELLDQTFTSVDAQLEKLPLKNSGCTAAIAVLRWEDRVPSSQSATGSQSLATDAAVPVAAAADAAAAAAATTTATPSGEEEAETMTTETAKADDGATKKRGSTASSVGAASAVSASGAGGDEAANAKLKPGAVASRQRVLYTANVGDARIILCRSGTALRLSYDHKGSDENEGRRVASAGGLILNNRVNGVLAVTRALGDTYIKGLVTGRPYTTETVIQPETDEFIIVACDGLWDVCSDQEAVNLVRDVQDPHAAAKMLVDHALDRMSTDNLSCMIVRLDKDAVLAAQRSKDHYIGVEGDEKAGASSASRRPSEADKIVSNARQKIAAGAAPAVGVSASNSGRGHDPVPSPVAAKPTASLPGGAGASNSSEETFKRTAIKGSVEEEAATTPGDSSSSDGSSVALADGSVQTAATDAASLECAVEDAVAPAAKP